MQYIGYNIKKIRLKHNWTQLHVSEKMGMSQTTLSRIENDPLHQFTDEEVKQFAEVLETTEEKLRETPSNINYHNNNIKGNGYAYIHQQTNNAGEELQKAVGQLYEISQQMTLMIQDLKSDKDFLKEENRKLRERDEKWMLMLSDMQKQLVDFLSKK